MKWLVLIGVYLISLGATAQPTGGRCGTTVTPEQLQAIKEFTGWMQQQPVAKVADTNTYYIPIKFHVIRRSNGTGGVDTALLPQIIDTLNFFYINSNIQFEICGEVNFVHNDQFTAMEATTEEKALTLRNSVPRVLNIYLIDSVMINDQLACGYAYIPDGPLDAFITKNCVLQGNTIAHEVGHIFSLIHTHGPSNSELTNELVNGANCPTAGDEICDTEADPNLDGKVGVHFQTKVCTYQGTDVDANGQVFDPDLKNVMSYSPFECKLTTFSPLQYERIYWSLFFHKRIDMICTNENEPIDETRITSVYPNPFSSEITIEFDLKQKSDIALVLYDIMGRRLLDLVFDEYEEGKAKLYVPLGAIHLAEGIYVIRMEINDGADFSEFKILRLN